MVERNRDGTILLPKLEMGITAFFCRCGYYSSNPYDFNDCTKKDYSYKYKREFQMEKNIFMLEEELLKLKEEKKY